MHCRRYGSFQTIQESPYVTIQSEFQNGDGVITYHFLLNEGTYLAQNMPGISEYEPLYITSSQADFSWYGKEYTLIAKIGEAEAKTSK